MGWLRSCDWKRYVLVLLLKGIWALKRWNTQLWTSNVCSSLIASWQFLDCALSKEPSATSIDVDTPKNGSFNIRQRLVAQLFLGCEWLGPRSAGWSERYVIEALRGSFSAASTLMFCNPLLIGMTNLNCKRRWEMGHVRKWEICTVCVWWNDKHWKALDEISHTYILLHVSKRKCQQHFVRLFLFFLGSQKSAWCSCQFSSQFLIGLMRFSLQFRGWTSSEIAEICSHFSERFASFQRNRQ